LHVPFLERWVNLISVIVHSTYLHCMLQQHNFDYSQFLSLNQITLPTFWMLVIDYFMHC